MKKTEEQFEESNVLVRPEQYKKPMDKGMSTTPCKIYSKGENEKKIIQG